MRIGPAGRTGEALVAVFVGAFLAHEAPRRSGRDACADGWRRRSTPWRRSALADTKGSGHGRAVEGPLDHDRTGAIGLASEFGLFVVHDQGVAEGAHRQMEALGVRLGVAAVRPQERSGVAAGAHTCEQAHGGATGVLARTRRDRRRG